MNGLIPNRLIACSRFEPLLEISTDRLKWWACLCGEQMLPAAEEKNSEGTLLPALAILPAGGASICSRDVREA